MKQFKCDMFVVPNIAPVVNDSEAKPYNRLFDNFETPPTGDEIAIQVWMCSPECENWFAHGHEVGTYFVPLSMLAGKKEGDTVVLKLRVRNGFHTTDEIAEVACTLNTDYRYRQFGAFEKVLQAVTATPNWCGIDGAKEEMEARWAAAKAKAFGAI